MSEFQISALDLARRLSQPDPTPEQQAIIEAPLEPALVIAGAGSGKTETMANRVVWLIANGKVNVNEILGMTFTRKAAGELGERIRKRVAKLVAEKIIPLDMDELDQATVTTYNSFANRIYTQYALLIGRDPDATVLGEAAAWQLARSIAREGTGEVLSDLDKSLDVLTEAILRLSRAIADNVSDPVEIVSFARSLDEHTVNMPLDVPGSRKSAAVDAWVKAREVGTTLPVLVDLAVQFSEAKRRKGLIEYSDQVALALEICHRFNSVVADFRSQFKVVLLDEYQDTSVVQTKLLSMLFAQTPVMAVGDPHQSIYGWRGASADNIEQFGAAFGSSVENTKTYSLSTSWRNPVGVLAAANVLVSPLTAKTQVPVEQLRAKPDAPQGEVELSVTETIYDEAEAVAQWLKERVNEKTTSAMLCRSLKGIEPFKRALDEHGVPYHVVGLGGLLDEPVIVDLVCTLRVLHDATADSELVRLLTGARWAIAPKDIVGLSEISKWMSERDHRQQRLTEEVRTALRNSVVSEDGASLVDALDFVVSAPESHSVLEKLSATGLSRIKQAGEQIARLRRRVGVDLRELVTIVQQELLLDIEAVANESAATALSSLEAFMEPLSAYVDGEDRATLGGFLSWLKEAERRERLSPQSAPAEPGTVQIMTIHGAKGLEWDVVAIPRMVKDELPGNRTRAENWVGFGRLPFPFRGDAMHLPVLNWRSATTQVELGESYDAFVEEVRVRYDDEQRRLAYVALTRAKHSLLLSASFWATQVAPRPPGIFLQELAAAGILGRELPLAPGNEANPLGNEEQTVIWPLDPLGSRRDVVMRAAEAVYSANPATPTPWDSEIELLLTERDRKTTTDADIPLPERIPASRFKDFIENPEAVAKSLRRPLPERPYRATSLGTLFHSWVEQRSVTSSLPDLVDATAFELDGVDELSRVSQDEQTLAQFKRIFEQSQWAHRKPVAVELEVNVPFGNSIIICKIDAIYEVEGSNGQRFEIVDWKTGKAPKDAADLELKQFQLALYRMAYSRWSGVAPENIDAAFYFVAEDTVVRPERIYSESELEERWSSVTGFIPR
ncbi:ATP-dependent DNA helicase [Aurantimicrobium sp. INA4]|uniref:ATP-dependent DNA helicase n=1 Tax=Aurantimicrobium sp. INA4 TaxID=2986279 RepID=UPI0024903A06|nr:ATP-dependent DNA helicase [Aurantimicrobium sp. INA4]BDU11135.1 ATP-dependent DNA helicase [Aurantimicrobium sp. INA4]